MDKKIKLLVIEDSFELQEVMNMLFTAEGYEVVSAYDGQEALNLLKQPELPHMILLDLMMPVMDGIEFREKQKQDPRIAKIPTLIMTAHGDALIDQEHIGVIDVLLKPVELERLLKAVEENATA